MNNLLRRSVLILILLIGVITSPNAHAQFSDAASVSLETQNSVIKPNSEVTVSLEAYTIDMIGATVRWFINDTEIVSARGNRSVVVETGAIGSKQVVKATIARTGKSTITTTKTLIPSIIDIVIEADTHTPVFYEGRALPATGGTIRVVAIPITGTAADPATFSYDWKHNGSSVLGGPALGRQAIEIETARYGREIISVTVYDARKNNLGTGSISHRAVDPELYFYELNPLHGLSPRALTDTYTMVGDDVSIQAEPYFIEGSPEEAGNTYEWRVDGQLVNSASENRKVITLQRTENAGTANISLKIVTGKTFPELMSNSFNLFYQ